MFLLSKVRQADTLRANPADASHRPGDRAGHQGRAERSLATGTYL